ncbi:hypothetical protein IE987_11480 [Klebsiella pneumoniae]|uniref:Uncharacterized protein n=1 Tax=Klebsiella pneumoniae TaxID=573 RepID=A0A927DKG7_KLEPN|nr:hypothetical protein [Klebsiella pneumoniae]
MKGNFMSALRIELKKGFTNEGVVHELSWIPGVQTGAYYVRSVAERELTCDKKIPHQRKRLPTPRAIMRFSAI